MSKNCARGLVSFLFLLSFYVHAATLHVGPGQTYSSIQPAINAAVTGDHVVIHTKTSPYMENLVIADKSITLRSTDPEDPNVVAQTVVDANDVASVIRITGTASTDTVILGLTIQNGNAFWDDPNTTWYEPTFEPTPHNDSFFLNCGGGICVGLGCDNNVSVYNCVIQNNTASVYGGGLYNVCGVIRNCTILDNTASCVEYLSCGHAKSRAGYGGGLAFCGYDSFRGIIGCTIEGNTALGGGGLYMCGALKQCQIIDNTTLHTSSGYYPGCDHDEVSIPGHGAGAWLCNDIDDCLIQGNSVSPSTGGYPHACGGGLFVCNNIRNSEIVGNTTHLYGGGINGGTIENCTIAFNEATSTDPNFPSKGGGLFCGQANNCIITQNSAEQGGGMYAGAAFGSLISYNTAVIGGGAYTSGADGGVYLNCIFSGNVASTGGAAASSYEGSGSYPHLYNCTIAGNKATYSSGAVYLSNNSAAYLRNCIIYQNKPNNNITIPDTSEIDHCCVYPSSNLSGDTIFNCDPNFLQAGYWNGNDWIEGDYHLSSSSTCCIDTGSNNRQVGYSASEDSDFDGNPRIVDSPLVSSSGAIADIGAYEFVDGPVLTYQQDEYTFLQPMGTLLNGAAYVNGGHTRMALELDGIDDYCEISDWGGVGSSYGRLCSAWIQTTDPNGGAIASWGESAAGQKWMFRVATTGKLAVGVWDGYIEGTTTINDGKWHHVAAVLNGDINGDSYIRVNDILLFVDGVQETTSCYNGDRVINTATTQPVKIGVEITNGSRYFIFDGLIDDLRISLCYASYNPVTTNDLIKTFIDAKCHWTLDESTGLYAHDSSANRYHGILHNFEDSREASALTGNKWQQGILGNALTFDGVNDYVTLPAGMINPAASSFSAFAWVRLDEKAAGYQAILQQVDDATGTGRTWLLRDANDNLQSSIGGTGTTSSLPVFSTVGQWHHVGLTYNGQIVTLYVDGQPVGSAARTAEACTGIFFLGRHKTSTVNNWDGAIDDVRIYDRSISIEEIRVLADAALAHWKLDSTSGTDAVDSSLNGHHGILEFYSSTPWWVDGTVDGALSFNHLNYDSVSVSSLYGITGTQSRTCAGWIKTSYANSDNLILSWGYAATGQKWMFRVGSTGKLEVGVWAGVVRGNSTINDGNWHHIAAVLEDDGYPTVNEIKLYVDGVLQTTTCYNYADFPPLVNTANTQTIKIGKRDDTGTIANPPVVYFNGTMDDIRIYEYALTPARVDALYDLGQ